MKLIMFFFFLRFITQFDHRLENSIWISRISEECVDTLRFCAKSEMLKYTCEQEYTFRGTYKVYGDTVTIVEKDDSHSEDGSKKTYYRSKYLLQNQNTLSLINVSELIKKRWVVNRNGIQGKLKYVRIK